MSFTYMKIDKPDNYVDRTTRLDALGQERNKSVLSTQDKTDFVNDPTTVHNPSAATNNRTKIFYYPEYNFSEIITIGEIESLVFRSFNRKIALAMKNGWSINGKNQKMVDYVKARFGEIMRKSKSNPNKFIRQLISDLVWYSNACIVKVRDRKLSSGNKVKNLDPIAGLFFLPQETVVVAYDENGKVLEIGQKVKLQSKIRSYSKEYYYHFKINDRTGSNFGTPVLGPSKDDIRALRRIEENVEILIHQHLFPLVTITVGTEKAPASKNADGTLEVTDVARRYSEIPSEGAIVLSEREKMDVLGAKGAALDYQNGLDHYYQRVITGIETSAIDMGEGDTANRSTADSLSRTIIDTVKNIQIHVEEFMEQIFHELLLESTFSEEELFDEANKVCLKFQEIDLDSLIKVQSHGEQLFTANGITHKELRQLLGYEEMTEEEWNDTQFKKITEVTALLSSKTGLSAEAFALAESPHSAITEENVSEEEKKTKEREKVEAQKKAAQSQKPSSGTRLNKSKRRPSNQHGTKTGPEGRKSSYFNHYQDSHERMDSEARLLWNGFLAAVNNHNKVGNNVIDALHETLLFSLKQDLNISFIRGTRVAANETLTNKTVDKLIVIDLQQNALMRSVVGRFIGDLKSDLARKDTILSHKDTLLKYSHRLNTIINTELQRSYNAGKLVYYNSVEQKDYFVYSPHDESCNACRESRKYTIDNKTYFDLPPISHPNSFEEIYVEDRK